MIRPETHLGDVSKASVPTYFAFDLYNQVLSDTAFEDATMHTLAYQLSAQQVKGVLVCFIHSQALSASQYREAQV